jgi:hypothetical protein
MSRIDGRDRPNTVAVWCLSTGRVGSHTLAELASLDRKVTALHEPWPNTYGLSRLSYEHLCHENGLSDVLLEAVRTVRQAPVNDAKIYLETSPQVTFLAPLLAEIFPNAKFVHVVRHPASVVRSAMRRNWYNGHGFDQWRICPRERKLETGWESMDPFEKNVWLWCETNRWVSDFLNSIGPDRYIILRSEDLFLLENDAVENFFGFLGVATPARRDIVRVIDRQYNAQRTGRFPRYEAWTQEQRMLLRSRAGELMRFYGYEPD